MRALFRFVLALIVAGVLAAIHFAPQLGLQQLVGVSQALAMRNLVTVGVLAFSIVLLMVWAFTRAKTLLISLVCFGFVALSAVVMFQHGIATTVAAKSTPKSDEQTGTQADLRILSWNTNQGSVDAAEVADAAESLSANVIALPETSPELAAGIVESLESLGRQFTLVTGPDEEGISEQSSLLLDASLGDYELVPDDSQVIPAGLIADPVDQDMPRIVVAHAQQPGLSDEQAQIWRDHLAWYSSLCTSDTTVIAGDFNATVENLTDGQLGSCRNVAVELGAGSAGTWPTTLPAWLGAPIDQFYAGEAWTPTRFSVLTSRSDAGSDHRPVFTTLQRATTDSGS